MLRHRFAPKSALLLLGFAASACGDDITVPEGSVDYTVEVSGEQFRVRVSTSAQEADFDARLATGETGVVLGSIVAGDGGFNAPWNWHFDPASAAVADMAIEVCDGRPSMIEDDLSYWLDTLGQFCPWGAKVVEKHE